ncbi:hypothetical protein IWQ54_006600 [Labrenzia sp. EL_195]|nr:hypothetical protein [Labrenzia sp. EL_195]
MMRLPPLPTLLLAGAVVVTGVSAAYLGGAPEISGLGRAAITTENASKNPSTQASWLGPRAETKREILIAPLFAEDRKLPAPFENLPQPSTEAPPEPKTQPDLKVANAAPPPPAPEPVADVAPEPAIAEPAIPAVPLDLPELRLVGTFIAEDRGIARALLIETDSGAEEIWVDEDSQYADWVLTIVSPEAVRLESGDESLTLEMWVEE